MDSLRKPAHVAAMTPRPLLHVVEDDDEIRDLLSDLLEKEGFDVAVARNGEEHRALMQGASPDLVILDLMLPGGEDGLSICRRLRATGDVPVLMLTAKSDEIDRILGIEMGADDYLTKPFSPRELTARIRAILRRTQGNGRSSDPFKLAHCGHLVINYDRREVRTADGELIPLSSGEYALFTVFLSRPQRVLDRDLLMDLAHGRQHAGVFDRSIDVQVSRLRQKIERDPSSPALIKTIRNGGYMLAEQVKSG